MPEMTIVEAVRDTLSYEMERDPRVMVLGEDVGKTGGVFRATEVLAKHDENYMPPEAAHALDQAARAGKSVVTK